MTAEELLKKNNVHLDAVTASINEVTKHRLFGAMEEYAQLRTAELEAENRGLRETIRLCIDYWDGERTDESMYHALEAITGTLEALEGLGE